MIISRTEAKRNAKATADIEKKITDFHKTLAETKQQDNNSQWWKDLGLEPSADLDFLIGRSD